MILKRIFILLHIIITFVSGCDPKLKDQKCNPQDVDCIPQCNPHVEGCISDIMSPGMRAWMASGQPKYGIQPIDPLKQKKVTFTACEHKYTLEYVTIKGLSDNNVTFVTFWSLDVEGNNVTKITVYNLYVKAKRIVDKNGKTISKEEPITIQLENYNDTIQLTVKVKKGKDGELYISMPDTISYKISEGDVKINTTLKNIDCDPKKIKQALGNAIHKAASEQLTSAWLKVDSQIPIEKRYGPYENWKVKPKPKEDKKKCCKKQKGLISGILSKLF